MDWKASAELLGRAISTISRLLGSKIPAQDLLTIIGALVESVSRGDLEKLDPATAEGELDRLLEALSDSDEAADRALDRKFGEE
jgi:hypothetical protein